MYVDKDTKHKHVGVKQMKDKTRVTLMVCTGATPFFVSASIKKCDEEGGP